MINPIKNLFYFEFLLETRSGYFIEKNQGQIIIAGADVAHQAQYARWAKVLNVGPDVKDFKVGDIVLIEALKWTTEINFESKSFWQSDESHVIAIGQDESVAYSL